MCDFCNWPEGSFYGCHDTGDGGGGYMCVRELGHNGPHVACAGIEDDDGKRSMVAMWDDNGPIDSTITIEQHRIMRESVAAPEMIKALFRVAQIARVLLYTNYFKPRSVGLGSALTCPHGNAANQAWWCDECWIGLEMELEAAGFNVERYEIPTQEELNALFPKARLDDAKG